MIINNRKTFHGGYMLKKLLLISALSTIVAVQAIACTIDGQVGLLPENDMWISSSAKSMMNSNIDEAKFNEVIDSVVAVYAPIVQGMGSKLKVERNWDDGTVNAYAHRRGGSWNVAMFGGLARHNTITPDGFALVVCHEVGHHIGGAPKKGSWSSAWASNEGQSDYFATLKCLRKVFQNDNNKAIVANLNVPASVTAICAKQFNNAEEQAICARGSMAGMSTARLFQELRKQPDAPKFTTPSAKVVKKTDHNHPETQCRLDTYFAGAICDLYDTDDVDQKDEAVGTCYRANGDVTGVRPLCWFAAKK
jgi:hypothetical protein